LAPHIAATWPRRHTHDRALPTEPVAIYLTARAAKPATLQRRLSSISQAYQAAGPTTPAGDPVVRAGHADIRRTLGTAPTVKAPARYRGHARRLRCRPAAAPSTSPSTAPTSPRAWWSPCAAPRRTRKALAAVSASPTAPSRHLRQSRAAAGRGVVRRPVRHVGARGRPVAGSL
jgi:hypothetical protein